MELHKVYVSEVTVVEHIILILVVVFGVIGTTAFTVKLYY